MRILVIPTLVMFTLVAGLVGCGQTSSGSQEAIETAKTMEVSTEEKVKYLTSQAKAFYNSKQFQDSVDVAQYVLRYLDRDSQEAKELFEMAKKGLMEAGEGAMADAKKKFSF